MGELLAFNNLLSSVSLSSHGLTSDNFIIISHLPSQKKDTNNRPSEKRNRRKTRNKIINKTSYFLFNSNFSLFFLGIHLLKMFHSKREVDKIKEKRDEICS